MLCVRAKTNPFSSNACSICNDVKYHAGETAECRGDCVVFRGCGGGCYVVNGQGGVGAAQVPRRTPTATPLEILTHSRSGNLTKVSPLLTTSIRAFESLFIQGMSVSSQAVCFAQFRVSTQVFYSTKLSAALVNLKPILPGHCLVIPRRVVPRFTDLSSDEVPSLSP